MPVETPECERMVAVAGISQQIGEFLEWMQGEKDLVLAKHGCPHGFVGPRTSTEDDYGLDLPHDCLRCTQENVLWPQHVSITNLLAEYFKIDLDKVEAERRAILEDLRKGG